MDNKIITVHGDDEFLFDVSSTAKRLHNMLMDKHVVFFFCLPAPLKNPGYAGGRNQPIHRTHLANVQRRITLLSHV